MAKNGIEFTLKDNSGAFLSALPDAKRRGLKAIAIMAESYAKEEISKPKLHGDGSMRPNVDTGRLRNSITHTNDDQAAYIGTNVEYAPYVELGSRRSKAYPYLKPAATEHGEEYKELMKQALKS